ACLPQAAAVIVRHSIVYRKLRRYDGLKRWPAAKRDAVVYKCCSSLLGLINQYEEPILILPSSYYAFSGDFEATLIIPLVWDTVFNNSLPFRFLNFILEQVDRNRNCSINHTFIIHGSEENTSNLNDTFDSISDTGYPSLQSRDHLTREPQRLKFFDCPCLQRPGLYKIKTCLIKQERRNEINRKNATSKSDGTSKWAFERNFRVMESNISVRFMKKDERKEIGAISQWSDNIQIKIQVGQRFQNINRTSLTLDYWNFTLEPSPMVVQNLTPGKHWWTENETLIDLPCEIFDKPGLWTISLKIFTNRNSLDAIFRSSKLRVKLNDQYKLKMATRTIFPCYSPGVSISFDFPTTCPKIYDEKSLKSNLEFSHFIRLYGISRNFAQQGKRVTKYLAEKRIAPAQAVLDFNCNYFDLIYFEYCFTFVTLFDDGMVFEHDRKCLSTQESRYNPINGGWSPWLSWGPCAVSCGQGIRSRARICNYPKPKYYGSYCQGRGLDVELCEANSACPKFNHQVSFSTDRCKCGCLLNQSEDVVVINLSSCKHSGQFKWIIESDSPSSRVFLKILSTNFLYGVKQALYIRSSMMTADNSSKSNGILLFKSFHDPENFEYQHDSMLSNENAKNRKTWIASRSNRVIIEYQVFWNLNLSFSNVDRTFYGAVIKYKIFETSNNGKYRFTIDKATFSNIFIPLIFIICLLIVLMAIFYHLFVKAQNRIKDEEKSRQFRFNHNHYRNGKFDAESTIKNNPIALAFEDERNSSTMIKVQITPLSRTDEVGEEKKPLLLLLRRKSSNLPKIPEEMQISTHTQSTRLSAMTQNSNDIGGSSPRLIGKNFRSIGIQLNSPALLLKRHSSSESKFSASTVKCSSIILKSTNQNGVDQKGGVDNNGGDDVSPNLSWTGLESQPDFEYDYSEFAVPGSLLNPGEWPPPPVLHSEIFIDDIIAESELMATAANNKNCGDDGENVTNSKTSISTQVYHMDAIVNDNEDDNCQKLFDNLRFSPRFHYL
uniref:Uncharacterized protein n=1 Tax=Romanomermis culicivorax TaxID=13658 RepID=A0A915JJ15_ROMCU